MTQLVNENKKKTGTLPFRLLLIAAGAGILLKLFVSYLFPLSRLLLRFVVCPLLLILIILTILKAGGRQRKKRVLCGVALAVGAIIFSFFCRLTVSWSRRAFKLQKAGTAAQLLRYRKR